MQNKNLGESLTTVLAVIASAFTTISVIIPFFSGTYIDVLFVDPSIIRITSVFGFITFLFSAFFTASLDFFIFLKGNFEKIKTYRFYSTLCFTIAVILLYGAKQAYTSGAIVFEWASFIQISLYLTAYFFAGISTGTTVESINSSARGKQTQYEIYDTITQTLMRSHLLPLKFQVISINQQHTPEEGDRPLQELGHDVIAMVDDKLCKIVFSQNYDRILIFDFLNKETGKTIVPPKE